MRLIDAEKVVHEYYKNPSYQQLCKVLNEAPTVKAIPREWIERKLTEYICSGKYSSDRFPIVYSLIADWRKENEESLAE